ncbi:mucin-19-like [Microcaecilia unicolor]|uniref:Mucin-19-like n=1 Tax=Microcaecilia unicolor TaxID=1415580 RepID=A0A6P7ZAA0_9AMPH|nr:mucin-19-like [Microcaecilia unicolor]
MVRNSNGKCVPLSQCPCVFGGEEYNDGETTMSNCNKCVCKQGTWQCTENECKSTCSIFGDGHTQTFDGKWYHFNGVCKYTVVTDYCGEAEGSFQIVTQSIACCEGGVTCARTVTIMLPEKNIVLEDGKVTVVATNSTAAGAEDDEPLITKGLNIERVGLSTYVGVDGIFSLQWDQSTRFSVTLETGYKGKVCGLCGNNNGDMKDDFTTRQNSVEAGSLIFANTWKTETNCKDTETEIFPCDKNPYCKLEAEKKCSIIKESTFQSCHSKVPPDSYYDACKRDACICGMQNKDSGLCNTIAMYAQACNNAGACIDWRSPTLCPIYCDYYNSPGDYRWHYEPCGTIKSKTCNDQFVGQKFSNVVEGCFAKCPAKAPYLDTNLMKCVSQPQCSCFYKDVVPAGSTVTSDQRDT